MKSSLFYKNTPYLIAEIGGNHEGDFEYALELLNLAIESGSDCVKFQLYKAESLVNQQISPDRYHHFKKFELSKVQHIELANRCINAGLDYLCSAWDFEMIDYIDPYVKHYKIGSGDLTNVPLLREFSNRGKPIILSTGLSTMSEVTWAINQIRQNNPVYEDMGMITLLQCTSMYPIPCKDSNLNVMDSFKEISNVMVGYSDHTVGLDAMYAAVAHGAQVLEFHFTDSREGKSFRDHQVSLVKDEVKVLRTTCQNIIESLGSSEKKPTEIEIKNGHVTSFRRAIYPKKDLSKGDIIKESDLVTLRPCKGIGAEHFDDVIGKKLTQDISALQPLEWGILS